MAVRLFVAGMTDSATTLQADPEAWNRLRDYLLRDPRRNAPLIDTLPPGDVGHRVAQRIVVNPAIAERLQDVAAKVP